MPLTLASHIYNCIIASHDGIQDVRTQDSITSKPNPRRIMVLGLLAQNCFPLVFLLERAREQAGMVENGFPSAAMGETNSLKVISQRWNWLLYFDVASGYLT
jgi:hypothetical protein